MVDHQSAWVGILSQVETHQSAFASLCATLGSTVDTVKGTASPGGELDKIIDRIIQVTVAGAPSSNGAKPVVGLASEGRKHLRDFVRLQLLSRTALAAANVSVLAAAAKAEEQKNRVAGM
jgi:hypothetical protein